MDSKRLKPTSMSRAKQAFAFATLATAVVAGTAATIESISVDRVAAVWAVNDEVGESSLVIPIRAAHPDCPSWSTLGGLVVESVETDDSVTITATFPEHGPDVPCSDRGSSMAATVKLDRPLGDREVINGATGLDPATPITIAFYTGNSPGSPG